MREILFRGKMVDNGEWWFGSLITPKNLNKLYCIHNDIELPFYRGVTPETIGQYTGLTDKNGNKIFEGDILQIWNKNPYNNQISKSELAIVVFEDGCFGYMKIKDRYHFVHKIEESNLDFNPNQSDYKIFEVIGNIYDNPELLGEAEK